MGTPGGVIFTGGGGVVGWSLATPQERAILGPSNGSWDDSYGVGGYSLNDATPEQLPRRSGAYSGGGGVAGVFALTSYTSDDTNGFRCAR